MACEFDVSVTAPCTSSIHDILMVTRMTIAKESFNVQASVDVEKTDTTLWHCDDIVAATQIPEWSLGMVYEGEFGGWLRSR